MRQKVFAVFIFSPLLNVLLIYGSAHTSRLMIHVNMAFDALRSLGFADKDLDEVKGIFADTNMYLLCATVFISSMHVSL